jgi:C-terminal processing protease CtpA/Prc
MNKIVSKILVVVFSLAFLLSCDKKEDPAHPNEYVNSWILGTMQFWYYWNTNMPTDPDRSLEHEEFFQSLINTNDRFSWIQKDYLELLKSLQGVSKEAGMEFALYRETEGGTTVIAQILYVKPNSPVAATSLKRGDIIKSINGQGLTTDNYKTLLGQLDEPFTITYKSLDVTQQQFGAEQSLSLVPIEYAENPNFLNKVFTYNDRKIGYYVYNLFSNGPTTGSKAYSDEMDQIFADFKSKGITDLIVDLRYNSGGSETATQNLASLIAKNVTSSNIFAKRQYNADVTKAIKEDPKLGEAFLVTKFLSKSQNLGGQLQNSRVYILTGSRSASASELLINGLKPYMDVFLIGSTTVGKNVGSISLYEENDPKNTWGIQPIVVKVYNSLDQSDYGNGFVPQIVDEDKSLYLHPLGDPSERLLNRALKEITGLPDIGRSGYQFQPVWPEEVGHSLDFKVRGNLLMVKPFADK